jgi:hypothetical protein
VLFVVLVVEPWPVGSSGCGEQRSLRSLLFVARLQKPLLPEALPQASDAAATDGQDEVDR